MSDKTKRKQQTFLQGAFTLIFATAIVKIIGAVFRIPLTNLIGESGMGYFSTAYDLYLPIYSLAMAGLPIAISRIVAEHVAAKRFKDVRKTLKVAKKAFWVTGMTGFVIMLAASYPFALFTGNSGCMPGIIAIAPSLLFCCIMSSYRGYYEGLRDMHPTAVSSVIEALGKLLLGYGLAFAVIKYYGEVTLESASYAAAAALFGITIGSGLGATYLVLKYRISGSKITAEELAISSDAVNTKQTLRTLVMIAVPIVLGSLVTNVAALVDVAMVQRQLASAVATNESVFREMYSELIQLKNLSAEEIPNALYGCYKGYAYSIYNLIPTITSVLGISAIPVLATSWTVKNKINIKKNIESILKTSAMIAMPAGIGVIVLAKRIMMVLYSGHPVGVAIAEPILMILGLTAIAAGITVPVTNMLQAIGKQNIPVRNIAIGVVLKIIVNYILVGIPSVNIIGAPIGTAVCYTFIAVANMAALIKYSGVKPNLIKGLFKPFISSLVCGGVAFFASKLLATIISSNTVITMLSIILAAIFYVFSLFALKIIDKEDLLSLPMGEKIAKRLAKSEKVE